MTRSHQAIDDSRIDQLLASFRPGYSLEQAFYCSPEIFEEEYTHLFSRQWQFTDHISRIPNKGDFFLFKIAGEEIIVVRGDDDTVYAHFNVCRHRGSRVCLESQGHVGRLTCPYHAWSYRLDGSLFHARAMSKDIDRSKLALHSCQVRVFEGLIFINLTAEGKGLVADFDAIAAQLRPWLAQADLRHTKIACTETFRSKANWKAAHENYFECYHCPHAHPEWSKAQLHYLRDGVGTQSAIEKFEGRNQLWAARAKKLGHMSGAMDSKVGLSDAENYCAQMVFAERMLVNDDAKNLYNSLTPKGSKMPTKLLGSYQADDEGQVDWGIGPSGFGYTTCTATAILRITPRGPLDTDQVVTWLVHEDAKEGIDYDIQALSWLHSATLRQDRKIAEDNQAGITSRVYEPGPYMELEQDIPVIQKDYIRALVYGRALRADSSRPAIQRRG